MMWEAEAVLAVEHVHVRYRVPTSGAPCCSQCADFSIQSILVYPGCSSRPDQLFHDCNCMQLLSVSLHPTARRLLQSQLSAKQPTSTVDRGREKSRTQLHWASFGFRFTGRHDLS